MHLCRLRCRSGAGALSRQECPWPRFTGPQRTVFVPRTACMRAGLHHRLSASLLLLPIAAMRAQPSPPLSGRDLKLPGRRRSLGKEHPHRPWNTLQPSGRGRGTGHTSSPRRRISPPTHLTMVQRKEDGSSRRRGRGWLARGLWEMRVAWRVAGRGPGRIARIWHGAGNFSRSSTFR